MCVRGVNCRVLTTALLGITIGFSGVSSGNVYGESIGGLSNVHRGDVLCGIHVNNLSRTDAEELVKYGYVEGKDYVIDSKRNLYMPKRDEVVDGLSTMLLELQLRGVDVNQLVSRLDYSMIRIDMKDTLGQAFVWQKEPKIYLYGKYDFDYWDSIETNATAVHEFAHYVDARYMGDEDRRLAYAKLRGLPKEMVYLDDSNVAWGDMFTEIFAEDFKSLFIDRALYKVNQKPLSSKKKEKMMDMIVSWMVGDSDPSFEYSRDLNFVRSSGLINDSDVLFCDDQAGVFLREGISGSDIINWLVSRYSAESVGFSEYLNTIDVNREVWKSYKFYPSDVDRLTKDQLVNVVRYFKELTYSYVRSEDRKRYNLDKKSVRKLTGREMTAYTEDVITLGKRYGILDDKSISDPYMKVSRGKFAEMLVDYSGVRRLTYKQSSVVLKKYRDVRVRDRYARDIATVIHNGWMFGVKKGEFGTGRVMTKEQIAYLVYNLERDRLKGTSKGSLARDSNRISDTYKKAVVELKGAGIVKYRKGGYFYPKQDGDLVYATGLLTRLKAADLKETRRGLYVLNRETGLYELSSRVLNRSVSANKVKKRDMIGWLR